MTASPSYYQSMLEKSLGIPFTRGNSIRVLKNGRQIFPAMLEEIKKAKKRVELLTFVYWKGDIAGRFAKALAKKAEEGVEVYLILDSVGATFIPRELTDLMESKGVQIEWFRPVHNWKVWDIDNRTHRKVLICDGKVAFTGGVGIAEEWEGDARGPDEWRETHFRIEGPAVFGLQAAFVENWIESGRPLVLDEQTGVDGQDEEVALEGSAVQIIRTSASVRWSDIVMLYQTLIKMARKHIRIVTAYFNPDQAIVDLLLKASGRNIDVEIMMPGRYIDHRVAKVAGDKNFDQLLDAGVKLWYYQQTMLHAKIILIDNMLCCVGSANFNHRSMLKDDEVNMVILDSDITDILSSHFKEDLKQCEKVDEERWKKRGLLKKSTEKMVNMFKREI